MHPSAPASMPTPAPDTTPVVAGASAGPTTTRPAAARKSAASKSSAGKSVASKSAAKKTVGRKAAATPAAPQPAVAKKARVQPATARKATAPKVAPAGAVPAAAAPTPKEGAKRAKLVRDSFTMPQADFALIDLLKVRALGFRRPTKKSELLRAGLQALAAMPAAELKVALGRLAPLKTGRPKKAG